MFFPKFLGLAAVLLLASAPNLGQEAPAPVGAASHRPTNLVVTSPRICAALSVYELAQENDWGLRATVAQATLNGFTLEGRVPDCAAGVGVALTTDFEPARWQLALDAVDAVSSDSYAVSPDACARANTVVPLSAEATSPVAARAQCVIYGLAFVEVRP
ncbi:hypothetical protein ABE424_13100 [Stenotrophomonas sp. TWI1149]|uniref:hypothetical protein n=1 Tax=unclassified Stenotrophomonas TaxID=196198 RepID=UPI0032092A6E